MTMNETYARLTLLGAASEKSGLDRTLKVNTSKKRTLSLFRQGTYWYHALPNMREDWLRDLMAAWSATIAEHHALQEILGVERWPTAGRRRVAPRSRSRVPVGSQRSRELTRRLPRKRA